MEIEQLVDEAYALKIKIEADQEKLGKLKAAIIKKGAGEYAGRKGKALVIQPLPGIKANKENVAAARSMLAPEHFKALFEQVVCNFPVKSFRDVAAVLLKKKAPKFIALFENGGDPYVKLDSV